MDSLIRVNSWRSLRQITEEVRLYKSEGKLMSWDICVYERVCLTEAAGGMESDWNEDQLTRRRHYVPFIFMDQSGEDNASRVH